MLQDIISRYKDSFTPGASTELRAQRNLTRRVTLISGSLTSNQRTDAGGVGARAYRDGVYGFASAADYWRRASAKPLLAAVRVPTLALHGGADVLANADGTRLIGELGGGGDVTIKIYPELFHEIFNEPEQEQVLDDMMAWLAEH